MDILALAGAIIAFAAIIMGNSLEGGTFAALVDGPAFIIVMGGTLGAIVLQTPYDKIRQALMLLGWVVKPPALKWREEVERMADWGRVARREGLIGLENIAGRTTNDFHRKGLELLIDGMDPLTMRRLLESDCQARLESDIAAAQVFRSMGGYAPTIGILGAVIGLIQVMGNLANPDELGQGIATAFIATIYGVGFANLLFLPVADRIKTIAIRKSSADELYIEGLMAIAEGEHPRNIEVRLQGMAGAA